MSTIYSLPDEVLLFILRNECLSYNDVLSFKGTCKRHNDLIKFCDDRVTYWMKANVYMIVFKKDLDGIKYKTKSKKKISYSLIYHSFHCYSDEITSYLIDNCDNVSSNVERLLKKIHTRENVNNDIYKDTIKILESLSPETIDKIEISEEYKRNVVYTKKPDRFYLYKMMCILKQSFSETQKDIVRSWRAYNPETKEIVNKYISQ